METKVEAKSQEEVFVIRSCYNRKLFRGSIFSNFVLVPFVTVAMVFIFTFKYQKDFPALTQSFLLVLFLSLIALAFYNRRMWTFGANTEVILSPLEMKIVRKLWFMERVEIYLAQDHERVAWTLVDIGPNRLIKMVGALQIDKKKTKTYHFGLHASLVLTNISIEEAHMLCQRISEILPWPYDGV